MRPTCVRRTHLLCDDFNQQQKNINLFGIRESGRCGFYDYFFICCYPVFRLDDGQYVPSLSPEIRSWIEKIRLALSGRQNELFIFVFRAWVMCWCYRHPSKRNEEKWCEIKFIDFINEKTYTNFFFPFPILHVTTTMVTMLTHVICIWIRNTSGKKNQIIMEQINHTIHRMCVSIFVRTGNEGWSQITDWKEFGWKNWAKIRSDIL